MTLQHDRGRNKHLHVKWNCLSPYGGWYRNLLKSNPNICHAAHFSTQLWHRLWPSVSVPRRLQLTDGSRGSGLFACESKYVPRLWLHVLLHPHMYKQMLCTGVCRAMFCNRVLLWRLAPATLKCPWFDICQILSRCHNRVKEPPQGSSQSWRLEINTAELWGEADVLSGDCEYYYGSWSKWAVSIC